MLQALGARVVDDQGCDVAPGLAGLEQVASVDLAPALRALNGMRVVVLSDVENPLVGRRGALAVFGGQKGLPADDVEVLRRYDGWMVGYGRLLDAAITGVRAQGLLRTARGCTDIWLGAWRARRGRCRWLGRGVAGARRGATLGCGDGARSRWGLTSTCAMSTWSLQARAIWMSNPPPVRRRWAWRAVPSGVANR